MDSGLNEQTDNTPDSASEIPVVTDQQDDFALETEGQVADGVESLNTMPEIQPDNWENLDIYEREAALQTVEGNMAEIQGRPSVPVIPVDLPPDQYGGWDGEAITINANHLAGDKPVSENVDTVVHEGRHAFQDYALSHPEIVSDPAVVDAWRENMEPGNYIDPSLDPEGYVNQPVEADAWGYAAAIQDGVYGK